jgi:predicted HicB family RNase H-like nuclease
MAEPRYGTSDGVALSAERLSGLADEAERGYETDRLHTRSRRGRPPVGEEAATVFHVRLQPSLRSALERAADAEETTPSHIVRRALSEFLASHPQA